MFDEDELRSFWRDEFVLRLYQLRHAEAMHAKSSDAFDREVLACAVAYLSERVSLALHMLGGLCACW